MRFLVAVLALALSGCYRFAEPPTVNEQVRVVVTSNDARLVRAQAALQAEVAEALTQRLGWRVGPAGSAVLELTLSREDIAATASDRQGIPARWSIALKGVARLRTRNGDIAHPWHGVGHASGLGDESAALDQAARNGAAEIAGWLQAATPDLTKQR